MRKNKLLYFKGVLLNKSNFDLLNSYFTLIKVKDICEAKKILNKKKILAIYCDQKFFYDNSFLSHFTDLKYLITSTTSEQFIDQEFCKKKKIVIISLKKEQNFLSKITSTAEHSLGLMIAISRNYYQAIKSVIDGNFNRRPFGGLKMLSQSNLGIIGYGRLGKITKKICKPIFKNIFVCDKKIDGFSFKSNLKTVMSKSDFISIHIPLQNNLNFFSKKNIKIKKNFFLINTSRGEIADENFIIQLLKKKKLLGYATDVLRGEFNMNFKIKENIIFRNLHKYNILITPHIGGSTKDAWKSTEYKVIRNLLKTINNTK